VTAAAPIRAPRRLCESPIETLLVQAIGEEIARCRIECEPLTQAQIGPYRVDIMLEMGDRKLVVECDGAAYHAATKEQVERDKRRDRFFTAQGVNVMRFTGAEINRSPRACAAEVGAWLEADPSARKAAIIEKWERGELTNDEAERLIRGGGLAAA
jgi:very-short-patch-repair endonuclease